MYTTAEIDKLQMIMLYKKMGLSLDSIKLILHDNTDVIPLLIEHKTTIQNQIETLQNLKKNLDDTISYYKGEKKMSNEAKFEHLKDKSIQENETKYGQETRAKWGDEVIDASNQKVKKMSKWQFQRAQDLANDILSLLKAELPKNNPNSHGMQKVCSLHQEWIELYWPTYTTNAHLELVKMYTLDDRFRAYYDVVGKGATDLLYEAMQYYLKKDNSWSYLFNYPIGTSGRTRTDTAVKPLDFESSVSTDFTTLAQQ